MGILVVSKVFGGFSSHPNLLATMMGRLWKNRRHGLASRTLYRNSQETFFNNDGNISW